MTQSAPGSWHPQGMGKKLIGPLRIAAASAFFLAVGGALAPGDLGGALRGVLVGLLVATPILRVGFFAGRWWQIGDRRFALAALLLLIEVGAGTLLAAA